MKKIEKYMKYRIVKIIINSLLKALNAIEKHIKREDFKRKTKSSKLLKKNSL